ncbi:hypothetical protein [Symbioplanes lichenis]|uniref:hypothetical protein n=1 Tax=Symbioplanes lichenis TaxID=1629072 RepID=UPI002739BAC8|nr:hypothetical protein [Actinoplanes lichenis]
MSGFFKRLVLGMVASKLERKAHHGHNPMVNGMLREVNHRLGRQHHYGQYGHPGWQGGPAGPYQHGYHGHYRRRGGGFHGHYRQRGSGYHGHYRFHGHYKKRRFW